MSLSQQVRLAAPYAVAFSIADLVLVRQWAEERGLALTVATDQVLDGAEFEEMLVLAPPGARRRTLTIWRTPATVFAQTPYGRPRAFARVADVLGTLRPARQTQRAQWRRLLRLPA